MIPEQLIILIKRYCSAIKYQRNVLYSRPSVLNIELKHNIENCYRFNLVGIGLKMFDNCNDTSISDLDPHYGYLVSITMIQTRKK